MAIGCPGLSGLPGRADDKAGTMKPITRDLYHVRNSRGRGGVANTSRVLGGVKTC